MQEADTPKDAGEPAAADSGAETWRLFFALWPRAGMRRALQQHMEQWRFGPRARPTAPPKLHLTLLFMAQADPHALPALLRIGADVAAATPGFALCLDHTEVWQPGGIAHLAPASPDPRLQTLHERLATAVHALGIVCDRRPFRPHVTLARRAEAAQAPGHAPALHWQADELALVHSVLGSGRYALLGRWPLPGQAATG